MDPPRADGETVDPAMEGHDRAFVAAALDGMAGAAKEGLMLELASPLLSRLAALTTSAAAADLRQAPQLRAVIDGYMDALLAHRDLVTIVLGDPAGGSTPAGRQVLDAMSALRDELARGRESDLDGRIRAASALGAVHAAVLEPSEFDPVTVRNVIAGAAVAILLS